MLLPLASQARVCLRSEDNAKIALKKFLLPSSLTLTKKPGMAFTYSYPGKQEVNGREQQSWPWQSGQVISIRLMRQTWSNSRPIRSTTWKGLTASSTSNDPEDSWWVLRKGSTPPQPGVTVWTVGMKCAVACRAWLRLCKRNKLSHPFELCLFPSPFRGLLLLSPLACFLPVVYWT